MLFSFCLQRHDGGAVVHSTVAWRPRGVAVRRTTAQCYWLLLTTPLLLPWQPQVQQQQTKWRPPEVVAATRKHNHNNWHLTTIHSKKHSNHTAVALGCYKNRKYLHHHHNLNNSRRHVVQQQPINRQRMQNICFMALNQSDDDCVVKSM